MPKYVETVLPHVSALGDDPTDLMAQAGRIIMFTHIPSGKSVAFKAWITEFSDTYTPKWNSTNVYGRMDPIATYQGTSRQVSISWDVPSASAYDAYKNLQRISQLIRMLYPIYTNASDSVSGNRTLKAAPLLRLKFMNLATDVRNNQKGLVGFINGGFSYKPNMKFGVYDGDDGTLGRNAIFDAFDTPAVYPIVASLQCTFTVLHTHPLGFSDQWEEIPRNKTVDPLQRNVNYDNGPGEAFPYGVDKTIVKREGPPATNSIATEKGSRASGQQAAESKALEGKS